MKERVPPDQVQDFRHLKVLLDILREAARVDLDLRKRQVVLTLADELRDVEHDLRLAHQHPKKRLLP